MTTRKVSVYVAGASAEAVNVTTWISRFTNAGIEITHDWTADVFAHALTPQDDLADETRRLYAQQDLEAVVRASIFWLIVPEKPSIGCYVELGAALVTLKPIIYVSGAHRRTIFTSLATECFDHHAEVFVKIVALARGSETEGT